ncbi:MAG: type II secretion system F family protein [Tepidisphaeraceae bacterium]
MVESIRKKVEEGRPLSEAMRAHPGVFDQLCLSLVTAGETTGDMSAMLDRLATLTRKQLKVRGAVRGAMVYPSLLIGLGFVVLSSMIFFVLPRFEGLFKELDAPLPPTTEFLLWLSRVMTAWWWAIVPATAALVAGSLWWLRSPAGRVQVQTTVLATPRLGQLVRSLTTAKLARLLGTLMESKVPLLDALRLVRESTHQIAYGRLMTQVEDAVGRGEPISAILAESSLIAPCVQEAVRTGEASGRLGAPLVQMADFLDEENEVVVKAITSLIEPIILIALGVVVGVIALSMFLPLFDLVSAAQKGGH